jgi:transcriptional regulator with XRE-family HTH domain
MLDWLRKVRETEHKSQQDCAEAMGITQQMFSHIENGTRKPHYTKAQLMAEYLNFEKHGFDWTVFYESHNPPQQQSAGE